MPDDLTSVGPSNHDFNAQNGLTREQWRDQWLSSGSSNMDQLRNFVSQYGGQVLADNGTVMTPYGDVLDIGTAFRSGNGRPGWTQVNSPSPNQAQGSQFGPSPVAQNQMVQNQGAMPYNPHAPKNPNTGFAGGINRPVDFGNYDSQPFHTLMPTGQTDGTLLGTTFSNNPSPAPQNNPQTFAIKPNNWTSGGGSNSSDNPFGAPSFYKKQNTPTDSKPLPQNNMGAS